MNEEQALDLFLKVKPHIDAIKEIAGGETLSLYFNGTYQSLTFGDVEHSDYYSFVACDLPDGERSERLQHIMKKGEGKTLWTKEKTA